MYQTQQIQQELQSLNNQLQTMGGNPRVANTIINKINVLNNRLAQLQSATQQQFQQPVNQFQQQFQQPVNQYQQPVNQYQQQFQQQYQQPPMPGYQPPMATKANASSGGRYGRNDGQTNGVNTEFGNMLVEKENIINDLTDKLLKLDKDYKELAMCINAQQAVETKDSDFSTVVPINEGFVKTWMYAPIIEPGVAVLETLTDTGLKSYEFIKDNNTKGKKMKTKTITEQNAYIVNTISDVKYNPVVVYSKAIAAENNVDIVCMDTHSIYSVLGGNAGVVKGIYEELCGSYAEHLKTTNTGLDAVVKLESILNADTNIKVAVDSVLTESIINYIVHVLNVPFEMDSIFEDYPTLATDTTEAYLPREDMKILDTYVKQLLSGYAKEIVDTDPGEIAGLKAKTIFDIVVPDVIVYYNDQQELLPKTPGKFTISKLSAAELHKSLTTIKSKSELLKVSLTATLYTDDVKYKLYYVPVSGNWIVVK